MTDRLTSATEVAQHAFCPESVRLKLIHASLSDEARARLEEGAKLHDARRRRRTRSGGWLWPSVFATATAVLAGMWFRGLL